MTSPFVASLQAACLAAVATAVACGGPLTVPRLMSPGPLAPAGEVHRFAEEELVASAPPPLLGFSADLAQTANSTSQPRDAVVRLRSVGCGSITTGTGFWLRGDAVGQAQDKAVLVTNRHVVADAAILQGENWAGEPVGLGTHVIASTRPDLAVLSAAAPQDHRSPAVLRISAAEPTPGTPISVLGFPRGRQYESHRGTVTAVADDGQGNRSLVLDVIAEPGNSGSPVVTDDGLVVGIIYARRTDNSDVLAISASSFRAGIDHGLDPLQAAAC